MAQLLQIEFLKLKHTKIWLAATILPLFAILQGVFFVQLLAKMSAPLDPWSMLAQGSLSLFSTLILPVLIAIIMALLARVEHQQDSWKHLFALPVQKEKVYLAKLIIGCALVATSIAVFSLAMLVVGLFYRFKEPVPLELLLLKPALAGVAALPIFAVQFVLSFRFANLIVPLAVSAGLTLPALLAANSARFWIFHPWAYPAVISLREPALPLPSLLAILAFCLLASLLAVRLGMACFVQNDVL